MLYLAGDIGGTKTHLALFAAEDERFNCVASQKFPSGQYEDLKTIVREFWDNNPSKIERACFGIAGPVRNNTCKATNLPWVVDAKELEIELGIKRVFLINDLEANAYGVKTLNPSDFYSINRGDDRASGNQALISAGTGLGQAGLYYDGKITTPFPSEGGHCDFAPRDEIEIKLLQYLMKEHNHVSYERILCGAGFYELYEFYTSVLGYPLSPSLESRGPNDDASIIVTKEAMGETCSTCVEVVKRFVSIYGSESGNLVLKYLATGGLYIGGGIAPKILQEMKKSTFFDSFIAKGRFKDLLRSVPIHVILEEDAALKGAAYFCHKST